MRKFAVPMLLTGGLLLSATAFAAQETHPVEPASTAKHEMKHAMKAEHKTEHSMAEHAKMAEHKTWEHSKAAKPEMKHEMKHEMQHEMKHETKPEPKKPAEPTSGGGK